MINSIKNRFKTVLYQKIVIEENWLNIELMFVTASQELKKEKNMYFKLSPFFGIVLVNNFLHECEVTMKIYSNRKIIFPSQSCNKCIMCWYSSQFCLKVLNYMSISRKILVFKRRRYCHGKTLILYYSKYDIFVKSSNSYLQITS